MASDSDIADMIRAASPMVRRSSSSRGTDRRRFVALFGVSATISATVWNLLPSQPDGGQRHHFLWALMFLKQYSSENVHAMIANVDEKTFRKWCWLYLRELENMSVVATSMYHFTHALLD